MTPHKKSSTKKSKPASDKKTSAKSPKKAEKKSTKQPKATSKQSDQSKTYFKHPDWLVAWHNRLLQSRLLSGGILALILVLLAAALWHVPLKLIKPDSIGKMLPADQTVFFMEWEHSNWNEVPVPTPLDGWSSWLSLEAIEAELWVGDQRGVATLVEEDGSTQHWYFVSVSDRQAANAYMNEADHDDAMYTGDHIVWGLDDAAKNTIDQVRNGSVSSSQDSTAFTQLRPRLPYEAMGLFYLATDQLEAEWIAYQEGQGSADTEWRAMLQDMGLVVSDAFPVILGTWTPQEGSWVMEAQAWGDKSLNEDQALFHFKDRYQANLLNNVPGISHTVWGMQNPAEFLTQSIDLLNGIDGLSGWILDSWLQQAVVSHWGETELMEQALIPLLSNEVAIAWVEQAETCEAEVIEGETEMTMCGVSAEPLAIIELTKDTLPLLEIVVADLTERGWLSLDEDDGSLYHSDIDRISYESGSQPYYGLIKSGGSPLVYYRVKEDEGQLWLTQSQEIMELLFAVAAVAEAPLTGDRRYVELEKAGGQGDVIYLTPTTANRLNFFDDGIHLIQVVPSY